MSTIQTTTDLMLACQTLEAEAELVSSKEAHGAWWDKKVALLHMVNGAFETGYFTGDAYSELSEAKSALYRGERKAGRY